MTNLLTHTPPTLNAEQRLAANLLSHINLKPRGLAEALASQHPFARIRDCVAHWWLNRRSVGGMFNETPGVIIYWLNHWDISSVPPLHPDFYQSDLYHRFRPPSEIQDEQQALAQAAQDLAAWYSQNLPQPPTPTSTPEISYPYAHAWQQIIEQIRLSNHALYHRFIFENLILTRVQEPPPQLTFTITIRNPTTTDWIQRQLTTQIQRHLRTTLKQPVTINFESQPQLEPSAP